MVPEDRKKVNVRSHVREDVSGGESKGIFCCKTRGHVTAQEAYRKGGGTYSQ